MKTSLLDLLCCPLCGAGLRLSARRRAVDEVLEGSLVCGGCGVKYPVRGGVPRLLPGAAADDVARTVAAFDAQWRAFPRLDPLYERQFFDWVAPVEPEFLRGKLALDAGCGKGRHLALAARHGARAVVGLDLGESVEVAYANAGALPGVHVVQGDLRRPPLRAVFDYAFAVGVLHHLPRPREGLDALARLTVPGGAVSAWVYGREGNAWLLKVADPLRRGLTSRLGPRSREALSFLLTLGVWPLSRLAPGRYLRYVSRFPFGELQTIVLDHLSPALQHYVSREEAEGWFAGGAWASAAVRGHNGNSWSCFAVRSGQKMYTQALAS